MWKFIRAPFRILWKLLTWTRILFLNLVFLVLIVIFFQGVSQAPEIKIPNKSALVIAPSGSLVDQSSYNPSVLDALASEDTRPKETVVRDIIKAIHLGRDDEQITGIILRLDFLARSGISKVEEIGQAINYFKESGKPVVAYADTLSQQQYLLATYADEIHIHPMGAVYLNGFGVYRNYYKSAAEKLHVKFHVFRVGKYKDAVEPYMRDDMSEQSREHISAWLTPLWQRFAGTIEIHRDLNRGAIDDYVNSLDEHLKRLKGDAALLAMESGLVDSVRSRNQMKSLLTEKFGTNKKEEINAIGMHAYLNNPLIAQNNTSDNKIGLIVASGTILDGEQAEGSIGSKTLSKIIRKAAKDKNLKALVLRVDSGGGSAFASEIIREELQLLKDKGLPVYISMGSVAASGGYWIAAPATEIWATPTTLTGSIGVFGLMPNFTKSLEKIGISSDGFGTSPIADAYHVDREMSPQTQRVIQSSVENIYQRFLALVAESRESTPEEIHEIAQGRVWSGDIAQQLGLVDKIGNLEDVFKSAAEDLNLSHYAVKEIKKELSPKEQFIRKLMEASALSTAKVIRFIGLNDTPAALLLHKLNTPELKNLHASTQANGLNIQANCWQCVTP